MKTTCLGLFALLWIALASPASAGIGAAVHLGPAAPPTVDVGYFYDELAPYGHWMETPSYGWAWAPAVEPAWRPYAYGRWVATDLGWTWLSDEPFGWATYHYGRWNLDPAYGWLWIPGDEWAPAWVSWRAADDYIGWAPLPPSYRVRPRFGFRLAGIGLPEDSFLFVPEPMFLEPRVVAYALPPGQARKLFRSSRDFTRYRVVNHLIVNEGVPIALLQPRLGRPVPRFQLVDLEPDGGRRARITGNRLALFRPRVSKALVAPPPARRIARRSLMTPSAAAETRRIARAGVFETKMKDRSPRVRDLREDRGPSREIGRHATVVRPREVRQGRSAEVGHLRAGPPQREARQGRGRTEIRRPPSHAAPAPKRRMQQRSDRSGRRLSSPPRHQERRQSVRPSQPHHRSQRVVRPDRHGGGGRRSAMRSPSGSPRGGGKGKRGGGRGR